MASLLAALVTSSEALLTNTQWKVVLNIGGDQGSLPLPLALRFAGDDTRQVDGLLSRPKKLEALSQTSSIVTHAGEETVPVTAIGWTEDSDRQKSLVTWCVDFPEGATRGAVRLPPGRVYCSAKLWQAADLKTKRRALGRLQASMASLEAALDEWQEGAGLQTLLRQLADRRRLDESIVALEDVPDADAVQPVPGVADALIAREGALRVRRERGLAEWLASRLLSGTDDEHIQIGTFSLRSMAPPPPRATPARAAATPRARASRMGLFDSLPGFWKATVPDGYARASHILFLGDDEEAEQRADAVLERIRSGGLSFAQAAREFSYCPTRDQEPAGDLGTFASLSSMSSVDEMRSFDGVMELPYEGQNTRDFDDAVFSVPLNQPTKVSSQWGYHLLLVTERGGGERAVIAPDAPASFDAAGVQIKSNDDAGRSL